MWNRVRFDFARPRRRLWSSVRFDFARLRRRPCRVASGSISLVLAVVPMRSRVLGPSRLVGGLRLDSFIREALRVLGSVFASVAGTNEVWF